MRAPVCLLLLWVAGRYTAASNDLEAGAFRLSSASEGELIGSSRQLLLRVLPGAGPPPSVCALPCSIPTDVAPSCQLGWQANGSDPNGIPICWGPCKSGYSVSDDGQQCIPTGCPDGYTQTDSSGATLFCMGCPPGYSPLAGIAQPGCYRNCPATTDSYDKPTPLCCLKCPKGYAPGANVRTCVINFLSAAQPFTSQRRCALRPYAPRTLQLVPQPRPQANATCPASSILVTASGAATCKSCASGSAYWAQRGRRGPVVRCRCGSMSDCPAGYRFCSPYCWDESDKIIYQVLGPLNGGYLCTAFLDATSDACSKTCPVRVVPPIDTNPLLKVP